MKLPNINSHDLVWFVMHRFILIWNTITSFSLVISPEEPNEAYEMHILNKSTLEMGWIVQQRLF